MPIKPIFFLDIDTQKDFLYPDGACFLSLGDKILPVLGKLTHFAYERRLPLISTCCIHQETPADFHGLPAHCLLGHDGAAKVPESLQLGNHRIENHLVDRNMGQLLERYSQVILEKSVASLLGNPNSARLLACLGKNAFVYGCPEDSLEPAIAALQKRGIQAVLVEDACAWHQPAQARRLLGELEKHGLRRITSKQLFAALSE